MSRLARVAPFVLCVVATAACGTPSGDVSAGEDDQEVVASSIPIEGAIDSCGEVSAVFERWRTHGYVLSGAKGTTIDVMLGGEPGHDTDTVLRIYGPRTSVGFRGRELAKDDDGGEGRSSKLSAFELPADGEYLLAASCKGGARCDGEKYALRLACAGTPKGSIAIEVDYVGYQRFEPGTIELVTKYFASIGYAITFEDGDVLEPTDYLPYGQTSKRLQDYYVQHFGHRGQKGWHYMLMADALENGNRGWGLLGGDMFVVSADPLSLYPERKAQAQANIILHELGHNLGLVHEGFAPELEAGTHDKTTCATADRGGPPGLDDIPVRYSPNCLSHITLEPIPMVK